MKRLKIVMITRHACIRVFKEALPLLQAGHEVHLITERVTQYADHCTTVTLYSSADHLYAAIKLFKDADVFHAHNEPSWFVTVCKEVFPEKPVVLDMHDSFLLRRTQKELAENHDRYAVSVDERNNVQLADGVVYVCEPMKKTVEDNFIPRCTSIVLPSYVPERLYRMDFARWWGGLVYEGRLDIPGELEAKWDFFQYANYLKLAEECRRLGVNFHTYSPRKNEKVRDAYSKVCFWHDGVTLDALIKLLGGHDWGMVGNVTEHPEWKYALPNKLYEYIAACLPVVALNADESSRVLAEGGLGITVNSLEELTKRWAEHRDIRVNIIKTRMQYAMERHIHLLEGLYEQLLS